MGGGGGWGGGGWGGGALSSLGIPSCIVCPNLCVKRLLLEWGRGGLGDGEGEDRETGREEAFGERKGMGKRGEGERWERKPKVGERQRRMVRGEWRGGTEETENRMGAGPVWYIQCSISLCAYLHCMGTCEVLKQQQSEEGEGDYYTFKATFYTEDSQKMNNTYQTTSQWLTSCDCAIAMLHIYYKILLYRVFDAYSTSCD